MARISVMLIVVFALSGCATRYQQVYGSEPFPMADGMCQSVAQASSPVFCQGLGCLVVMARQQDIYQNCLRGRGWVPAR